MKRVLAFSLLFFLIFKTDVYAQTMTNSFFKLIFGNLNSASGPISGSNYKLNTTVGQVAQGLYSGTNWKVRAGFQYVRTNISFSFTVSQNIIDFGTLTPTNPVTRTTDLTVSSGAAKGFTVILSEDRPMTSSSSATIPDTSCDAGDCTVAKAAQWTGTLTYGFGYRCDDQVGSNCVAGFSTDSYKPFPLKPSTTSVMLSQKGGRSRKSQITYKVNIAGSQAPGVYTNMVTYIASPGF